MCKNKPEDSVIALPGPKNTTVTAVYIWDIGRSVGLPSAWVRLAFAYFIALFLFAPIVCSVIYIIG